MAANNARFENRHVLITGGSSGIGKALAVQLAARGAHVSIIARTPSTLDAARVEIEAARTHAGQRVLALSADVSDRQQIERALQEAMAHSGTPDFLIASAGMAQPGYFEKIPMETFEQTMAVNYFGALYAVRAALPLMRAQRSGHVVLVSSGAGLIGLFGYSAYSPSKFALRGLAEALRGELKPQRIGISVVYPPDTDTPQLEAENLTKPLETKRITATAKTWSADAVAETIVRGIEKNAFIIAPGMEMNLLARLHSLIAPGLNRYFDSIIAKTPSVEKDSER